MDTIPSKQLHQKQATKAALKSVLSEREIGFCDADSTLYIKIGGDLVEAVPYIEAIAAAKQEILQEIGKPLQWIDEATVSYLNGTIAGLESGWTYTLTDSGTLTAGNVNVEPGDEVAWSEVNEKWVKIGGDAGKVTIYDVTLSGTTWTYPDASKIDFDIGQGKYVVLKFNDGASTSFYFLMSGPASASATSKSIQFYNFSTKGALLATYASNTWTWSVNSYSPYPVFAGSAPGLVPAATAGDASKALKGDGTWGTVSTVNVSYDAVNEELHLDFKDHTNEVLIGGRWYKTVTIGNQIWTAENLDWQFEGITLNPNSTGWDGYSAWYYDNDEATYGLNGTYKCGLLYTYFSAVYIDSLLTDGWRVPTTSDFHTLIDNVSALSLLAEENSVVSGFPNSYWPGNNALGLNLLPGGRRQDWQFNGFNGQYYGPYYWSTTHDSYPLYYWLQGNTSGGIHFSISNSTSANNGMSIRLVKDIT